MSDTIQKIQAFKKAKADFQKAKEELNKAQADLYLEMTSLGFDTLGTKETGQATIVYKKNFIFNQEATKALSPFYEQEDEAKERLKLIQQRVSDKKEELIGAGLAKEDKEFSYIKFTKPKK